MQGLLITIPSFTYIGEKPQQITYYFRDRYFYSEALRSSIAGTGFSSILEAYWNFGFPGVLVIYGVWGLLISKLDLYYKYKNKYTLCVYFSIAPFVVSFHRTAFGDIISNIIYKAIIILFIFLVQRLFVNKYNTIKRKKEVGDYYENQKLHKTPIKYIS